MMLTIPALKSFPCKQTLIRRDFMSKIIAFAGKGGVGKTTVATLVIRSMAASDKGPILAVDADPKQQSR